VTPTRDEDAVVDLLDVVLRDGVVVEADVVVTVADVRLVGIRLRAAVAGMTTMVRYGMFDGDAFGAGEERERVRDREPERNRERKRERVRVRESPPPTDGNDSGTSSGSGVE